MNTESTVGLNTSLRTAIIYKATHPSEEGIYVGCKLDSLEGYYTSSDCFANAIEATGIMPTLTPIDTLSINWDVEQDRQIPYQRELEVYDLLKDMDVNMLNQTRPAGFCYFVTEACEADKKSVERRAILSEAKKGIPKTEAHRAKLVKHLTNLSEEAKNKRNDACAINNRKVVSMLDGRVTSYGCSVGWNKKNPDYIGTWVDL